MKVLIPLFVFIGLSVVYGYFFFKADEITSWEIRYYVFVSTAVLMVFTFAVLRLYNAVVINSRFISMLNQLIKNSLAPKLKKMEAALDKPGKALGGVMGRLKSSIDTLNRLLTKGKTNGDT